MVETSVTVPFNGGNLVNDYDECAFCFLSAGKMLQVWRQDSPDWLFARVFNYDFSTSSEGSIRMYEGEFNNLDTMFIERLNSTQALHFYYYATTGTWYVRILTIDGSDNITESTRTQVTNLDQGSLNDGGRDSSHYYAHQKSNNTVWVMQRNFNSIDLIEFSVSGSTVTETQLISNLSANDVGLNGAGYGLREIPGTSNTVMWAGSDIWVINDSGVVQSSITSAHHNLNSKLTVCPESATSLFLFDDDTSGGEVQTWDGTDQGGVGPLVKYDGNGSGTTMIWSEQVDTNTWILWRHSTDDVYVKVVRRLDATTWQTSSATTGNGISVLFNQAGNSYIADTQPHFKPVQQVDANNFVTCWVNHNNANPFVIDFMNQT